MIDFGIDIKEEDLFNIDKDLENGVLAILLKDRTTGGNIIWATNDYKDEGENFGFNDEITIEKITGFYNLLIRPRIKKEQEKQRARSKDKAEVFTPSWVCNAQNNLIDNAWFGEPNIFNIENPDHTWTTVDVKNNPIVEKKWQQYVKDVRLEVTCGEAPYLVSRYDTTTGKPIPLNERIGIFDRKMRLVNAFTPDLPENPTPKDVNTISKRWHVWAYSALKSTYGFEYQGDNLLLARESVLASYCEYYKQKWGNDIGKLEMRRVAEIISWNIWQMDGLNFCIPYQKPEEKNVVAAKDATLKKNRPCQILEWERNESTKGLATPFIQIVNQQNKTK